MIHLPKLIQRSRAKGSRLPPNTRVITRGTLYGNPFPVSEIQSARIAVQRFWMLLEYPCSYEWQSMGETRQRIRRNLYRLADYDYVACWCRIEGGVWEYGMRPEPDCHGVVYIKLLRELLIGERYVQDAGTSGRRRYGSPD